jgi:peptidoglycan-N-acetylglucosamine deacetylase
MQSRTLRQLSLAAVVTATQLFFYSVALAHSDGESTETPLWQLSPEQIAAQVNVVRAGADLTPKSWPNGAKVAVSFSFDVDTEPVWMGFQKQTSPSYMSRGEFGARVGMPRVMKLLEKHEINATFFIPAVSMLLHPEIVPAILKHPTYEIGFHSYVHENPLDLTPSTIKLVQEMGFLYESSMMADDRPYRLIAEGKDTGLVELPVEWILDDWPYFQVSWPSKHVSMRNAEDVYSIWKEEFDGAYEEGTAYILTMHPQVIGHRYRIQMLDRLITYMKSKPGVWFATHEEIARYVKAQASE